MHVAGKGGNAQGAIRTIHGQIPLPDGRTLSTDMLALRGLQHMLSQGFGQSALPMALV